MSTLEMMGKLYIVICLPIIFNDDPLKACFLNKKDIYYNPNTPDKNLKLYFFMKKQVFGGFLKIIGVQI